ncbi:esterase-like activity of phytase family protein [Massilia pinisoli]|uniref:Esterase-like activity of phytase family protein n=1 Tax=Massilia pinisoli TaxID=1772194 RepID=A0ABT1ZLB1_9BURK|nr:esterase-like activity of phytase family protein [Massilia pinisoli]MCS0580709.1 esterase-like activity of phytase family protein [Massilia pinisoli]
MNKSTLSMALVVALCGLKPALAAPVLLATGTLNGSGGDLSSATAGSLENGTAGNLLGGIGSGLAWAGGTTFIATPDRGPNATNWNAALDNTTSYLSRFQTLQLGLVKNGTGWTLTPTLSATTLMYSPTPLAYAAGATPALNDADHYYFSGRSDNFDPAQPSTNPNNARLDPEGVRVSKDGKSIFVSDEYGPYVYQIDRASGQRIRSYALPANLAVTHLSAQGDAEISGNSVGRVANKGMEGLAITPDGKTLVGIMQAPLEQDGAKNLRIVTIDIATGATHEYAYMLTSGSGVSEIVALNDHQFLVDERDGKGLGDGTKASVKQIFKIDLNGAQDVAALSGDLSAKAVAKSLVLDVVAVLGANGIAPAQIPAKIEGLAFGADVVDNGVLMHTLYVANDNDFVRATAGDNKFYVFGLSDADLSKVGATYSSQQFAADVPEPASIALVLAGLGMLTARVRRRA